MLILTVALLLAQAPQVDSRSSDAFEVYKRCIIAAAHDPATAAPDVKDPVIAAVSHCTSALDDFGTELTTSFAPHIKAEELGPYVKSVQSEALASGYQLARVQVARARGESPLVAPPSRDAFEIYRRCIIAAAHDPATAVPEAQDHVVAVVSHCTPELDAFGAELTLGFAPYVGADELAPYVQSLKSGTLSTGYRLATTQLTRVRGEGRLPTTSIRRTVPAD